MQTIVMRQRNALLPSLSLRQMHLSWQRLLSPTCELGSLVHRLSRSHHTTLFKEVRFELTGSHRLPSAALRRTLYRTD